MEPKEKFFLYWFEYGEFNLQEFDTEGEMIAGMVNIGRNARRLQSHFSGFKVIRGVRVDLNDGTGTTSTLPRNAGG